MLKDEDGAAKMIEILDVSLNSLNQLHFEFQRLSLVNGIRTENGILTPNGIRAEIDAGLHEN